MKRVLWVSTWPLPADRVRDVEISLEDKLGCKFSNKKGQFTVYHPSSLPNEFILGKGVVVLKDTTKSRISALNEVFSFGPYTEQRKRDERTLMTEVSYSEFIDDPKDMLEGSLPLITSSIFWFCQQDQRQRV